MTHYYLNTQNQIEGDKAYNDGHYKTALTHYTNASRTLRELIQTNNQQAGVHYSLAYVLCGIIHTQANLIGHNNSTDQQFGEVSTINNEAQIALEEVQSIVNRSLKGPQKAEINRRLQDCKLALLKSTSVAYWNRAEHLNSMEYGSLQEKITFFEQAFTMLEACQEQIQQILPSEQNDHSIDSNHIITFQAQLTEDLSDFFGEQGDLEESPIEARVAALKQSLLYGQIALDKKRLLNHETANTSLHLSCLYTQEILFKLTQDQSYLEQITTYINQHLARGDFSREEQFEIKAYQFIVAHKSIPQQTLETTKRAKELIALGKIEENQLFSELYNTAEAHIQSSTSTLCNKKGFFLRTGQKIETGLEVAH